MLYCIEDLVTSCRNSLFETCPALLMNAHLVLKRHDDLELIGYFDSAHGDFIDCRSTCGYLFLYYGSPISWVSDKIME